MRRSDREQSREFALDVIDRCSHGVMAVSTEDGTPYCLPLSFAREGNSLYFHCAREGRKLDLLRRNPRVCITFVAEDTPVFVEPHMYSTWYQSAVVTGTAAEVESDGEKTAALRALCTKLLPDHMGDTFDQAVAASLRAVSVWRIDMDQVSGKAKLRH